MGANLETMNVVNICRKAVRAAFEDAQDLDRYENGHSYSGGFGMVTGLVFNDEPHFTAEYLADEWLDDNAKKWEAAQAVQIVDGEGQFVCWRIGANCAA